MKICHIATEISPIAKVGGLSDVTLGLARALIQKKQDVFLILPHYACLKTEDLSSIERDPTPLKVLFNKNNYTVSIFKAMLYEVPIYFLEAASPEPFFDREKIYGYKDDIDRFAFFSLAAIELLKERFSDCDIIHLHDWQTALVAPLKALLYPKTLKAKTLFTLHNLNYQGQTTDRLLAKVHLSPLSPKIKEGFLDPGKNKHRINLLKAAFYFSDSITTVSPKYAEEIQGTKDGKGLDPILRHFKGKLKGILNGIDYEIWNPQTDSALHSHFSYQNLENKLHCKKSLQLELNMPTKAHVPLVACVCRLVPQKGLRLIKKAIMTTLKLKGQFILFGSSPIPKIQADFDELSETLKEHKDVKFVFDSYNEPLAHRIYAGSDMIICPSIFEPCGLTQIIALRYGTVPIVRKVGGLANTVFDIEQDDIPFKDTNGFTFIPATCEAMKTSLTRAFKLYHRHFDEWQKLIKRGMQMNFSWQDSSNEYLKLYHKVLMDKSSLTWLTESCRIKDVVND